MTPLIVVAHGSRDPRSAATMYAAVELVRAVRPDLDVRLAFLDLNAPSVDRLVDAVAAQGHRSAIVVPLLLGSAFHARVDLPGLLAAARSRHPQLDLIQADVLGADERLIDAVCDRIAATGVSGDYGIALTAVGSSSAAANARTAAVARRIELATGRRTEICFATTEPSVRQAITALGTDQVVVAPWMLAPGLLLDRVAAAAPGALVAPPIGAHRLLAELVVVRYQSCRTRTVSAA